MVLHTWGPDLAAHPSLRHWPPVLAAGPAAMTGQSLSHRQERRGELAVNQAPPHFTCVSRVDVPSGTPGRPPFSSMNSTPAVSSACRVAALRMRSGTRTVRITAVGETHSTVSRVSDNGHGMRSKLSPFLAGTGALIGRRC
jgi:hypothetical protein